MPHIRRAIGAEGRSNEVGKSNPEMNDMPWMTNRCSRYDIRYLTKTEIVLKSDKLI